MLTEQEAQNQIKQLEKELGISPTTLTEGDVRNEIASLQQEIGSLPMTIQEFATKRKEDGAKAFSEKAMAFGSTIAEGFKELGRQGMEATDEAEGLLDFDAYGDIINIGSRDFWRFAKTIGGSIMDELGHTNQQELVREYMRYKQNFDYYQKVRPAMLESDEIEYKKLTDFGANFIDPFMAFPVAKVGAFAVKTTLKGAQKGLTAGAKLSRSQGMVNVAKGLRGTGRAIQKLERGVDIAGKIGAYPTEMASRMTAKGLRKGVKGTALVAGIGLKGIGAVGSGTAKVASAPRKLIEASVNKLSKGAKDLGGVTLGGQVVGGITGSVPYAMELGITEGIGLIAKKIGKGAGEVLTTLAQPASNKRFLYRLATNSKVSPQTRKLAMHAYNLRGTAMGDAVFNMMANGLSIGAINAGLAGVAGEDPENMGRAFGAGLLAGGVIPSGQQGMRAGKTDTARDMKSIDNHMRYKLTEEQRKAFKQMPKPAQVMLATLNESGIGSPKFMIMESKTYLEMLNADLRSKGKPELTKAPRGHYDPVSRTFYANKSKLPESSAVAMETIAHETGHDFLHQMLGNDPMMLDLLLENYKTSKEEGTAFYYEYDKDGNPLGEPIYLNEMAVAIRNDYDMKQRGRPATAEDVAKGLAQREGEMIGGIKLGNNASKLAQEIGADQFAMMFTKDPNAFNHFHPTMRNLLLNASRKLLSVLGMAEPVTGNPLKNPISRIQLNNPALRRLYENYGRARAIELNEKGKLAKDGMLINPKNGQTGEDRFMEMMGGNKEFQSNGLSLTEAKNLRVTNKSLQREINNIKKMYKEEPQDGWSVKRGRLFGKRLTPDLRTIFTRNDPFGNVATILDALQQAIDQGIGVIFGYRSGTKGKYQNPFRMRDVALYTYEVSGNSLKVNGYDQAVVRNNIQVLVENGYIAKDGIKDFERQLAEQGQKALADPEGRINPDGGAENTLMTAVFGLKESAENIRSEGIKDLLESGKLEKAYRSYDVEALAGIGMGRRKAFTFNYDNIRNNYNPFRQSDEPMFMPDEGYHGTQHTFAPEKDAPLGRFRMSKIGTGEGVQMFGYGLYFASRKDVGDYYRETLSQQSMFEVLAKEIGLQVSLNMMDFIKLMIRQKHSVDYMRKQVERIKDDVSARDLSEFKKYIKYVEKNGHPNVGGSLYKVRLAPREDQYLYRDKPLSEQPKYVQERLAKMKADAERNREAGIDDATMLYNDVTYPDPDGGDLYNFASNDKNAFGVDADKLSSANLLKAGIKGIKFLDGVSREKGEGSYNYIIFDEADVQITDKLYMPDSDAPANLPPTPYEVTRMSHRNRFTLGFNDNIIDEVVPSIKQDKFSGQQMIAAMSKTAGAKVYADEIGLTEFLNSKKSFEKSDVLKYMDENAPKLEVKRLKGEGEPFDHEYYRELLRESELDDLYANHSIDGNQFDDDGNEYFTIEYFGEEILDGDEPMRFEDEYDAENYLEDLVNENVNNYSEGDIEDIFSDAYERSQGDPDAEGATQYHEWAGDGGEDYQEVLVKLQNEGFDYDDPHFSGEENVILHLRTKTRYDNKGNRVFFIEEVQSDLHQAGRSEGYDNAPLKGEVVERTYTPSPSITRKLNLTGGGEVKAPEVKSFQINWEDGRVTSLSTTERDVAEAHMKNIAKPMAGGVPDAPFKKNWPGLGLKLAIQEAMDNGATKVAWLGGQGHVDRYPSMTKHIRDIYVNYAHENRKLYNLDVTLHNGQTIKKVDLLERDMVRLVGKKFTQKAKEDLARKEDYKIAEVGYVGLDLEIGKGGMLNFYDKEMVSLANKIGKKIGAKKVERYKNNEGIEGWEMELPPRPVRVKSRDNYNEFSLFMPDTDKVSNNSLPEVVNEVARKTKNVPVVENEPMFMPALEDAKSIVAEKGRVAENAEDVFFGAMLPKLLRKTGGQLKPSVRNIREATRRAIEDVTPFLRDNPQFADYYNKDMEATRNELDQGYGNVSDDDFLFYRTMLGLTSPGTKLPSNVGDGVNIFNLYKEKGNLDDIEMGTSEKGNPVIASSPFKISGTTAPTKARSLLIVDSLRKELGSVRDAIDFLEEGVPIKELHQFNKQMGYAGNVAKTGDIRRIVKQATGQDELIPRMFIFGPKVGAYTLNAVGNHNYNTIDVWEARFIRSYFKGMFRKNTGLPANVDEHALFTRFTEIFQEEFEKKTGEKMPTSALQAIRWFYMIDTAKKLGYSGASTNETISGYTKRYITKLRANSGGRRQGDGTLDEGVRPEAERAKGQSEDQAQGEINQFLPDGGGINRMPPTMPSSRFMRPSMTRTMATTEQLDRFVR